MYDVWFEDQIRAHDDSHAEEWDLFRLSYDHQATPSHFTVQRLARHDVSAWITQTEGLINNTSYNNADPAPECLRIMYALLYCVKVEVMTDCLSITRHNEHMTKEIRPEGIPFRKKEYIQLIKRLCLPAEYAYHRIHAGASGAFSVHTTRDQGGCVAKIGVSL